MGPVNWIAVILAAILAVAVGVVWYGPLFNLPAILVYVLWFWPRHVGVGSYRSRSWLLPLAVCFGLLFGMQKLSDYVLKRQPKEIQQQVERMQQQK